MRLLCRSPARQGCAHQHRCAHCATTITPAKTGSIAARPRAHRKQRLDFVYHIGAQAILTVSRLRHLHAQKPKRTLFGNTKHKTPHQRNLPNKERLQVQRTPTVAPWITVSEEGRRARCGITTRRISCERILTSCKNVTVLLGFTMLTNEPLLPRSLLHARVRRQPRLAVSHPAAVHALPTKALQC